MKSLYLLFILVAIVCVHSARIDFVDNWVPGTPTLTATTNGVTVTKSSQSGAGSQIIGNERDIIIFKDPSSAVGTSINTAVNKGVSWQLSYPQSAAGITTLQYDGPDNSSALSLNPGLQYDLTRANQVYGFKVIGRTDHTVDMTIKVYGSTNTTFSTATITILETTSLLTYYKSFPEFTGNLGSFASINAMEFSFNTNIAPDIVITEISLFGSSITGTAFIDCDQNGVQGPSELAYVNAVVQLKNTSSNAVLQTTNTDSAGDYGFFGLGPFTYTVCVLATANLTATVPPTGCRNVTLILDQDIADQNFGFLAQSSITAPNDITIDDCECDLDDLDCLGTPTVQTCSGPGTANYTDATVGTCPTVITRTWTVVGSPGVSDVQIITVRDETDPVITQQAQNLTDVNCATRNATFTNWLNVNANATATDCNNITWTNSYTLAPVPIPMCSSLTVTFTATDPCGNSAQTTGRFTTVDNSAPTFSGATNTTVECNTNGSDLEAFQEWLDSPSGVTDNCDSSPSINYTIQGTLNRGCDNSVTVDFTATDACGSSTSSPATFTISDTQGPSINTPASNSFAECSTTGSDVTTFNNWVTTHGGAVAVDACNSANTLTWTPLTASAPVNKCNNTVTITFTVTDPCGESNSTIASFNFRDTQNPVFNRGPSNQTFVCGGDITTAYNTWLDSHANVTATDACSGEVTWSTNSTGVPAQSCGTTIILFTATDSCARSSNFLASFIVTDNVLPQFNPAPVNSSAECGTDIQNQFLTWINTPDATDNCGDVAVTYNYNTSVPIPTTCNSRVTVIFTTTDPCGNTAFATATFSVVDTQPPTWTVPTSVIVECGPTNQQDYDSWVASNASATASDTCSSSLTVTSNATAVAPKGCNATTVVGFTARDSCQQSSTITASFSVVDTTDPFITKNATDQTVECDGQGNTQAFTTWLNTTHGGATAADSCTPVNSITWTNNFIAFTTDCTQTATVTFTANDACGHFANTTATFFIEDNSPPFIVSPARSTSASCDGQGNTAAIQTWLDSHGGAVASDACSIDTLTWTNDFDTDIKTCTSVTVTFFVTDECGRTANTTATFTVFDRSSPTFNPVAQNQTVECDGQGNTQAYSLWVATNAGAVADDVCATIITYTNSAPSTGPVGCGTVKSTIFATDQCNNTGRTTAYFSVVDTIAPVLTVAASNLTLECDGTSNAVALNNWLISHAGAVAVDSCNPNLIWTNDFRNLTATPCSTFATVTFTASDNCGNFVNTTATFSSIDTTPPIIDPQSGNATLECNALRNEAEIQQYLDSRGGAAAHDVCSFVIWSDDFITTETCEGEVQVVFTAADECGNTAETVGTIFVDDITPPTFQNFPADVTIQCDDCYSVECLGQPTVVDTCSPASGLLMIYNDTFSDNVGFAFCPGDRILNRTFTATDGCGNEIQQSQIIVISLVRPDGPCEPAPCSPCSDAASQCCDDSLDPIPCTPVPCTPVFCTQVPCTPVDCIPVVCGEDVVPSPTPIPTRPPVNIYEYECQPLYIYVYNDDGQNDDVDSNDEPVIKYIYNFIVDDQNSASSQYVTVLTIVAILFAIIF